MTEEQVLLSLHAAASPALDALFLVSHWIGDLWASAALVLVVAAWRRAGGERRQAWLWLASGVAVLVIEQTLKTVVARPRPDLWIGPVRPRDFSFPSGHAMASAAFYPLLAVTLARRGVAGRAPLLALAVVLSAFVGLGRLYLGVHWPSDVLAGWVLGGTVAVVAVRLLGRGAVGAAARPPGG